MATREQFVLSTAERRKRRFSDEFKKQKVKELELKQTTVLEVSRAYQVSTKNVYGWLDKFGKSYKKDVRLIVEMESDTKMLLELKAKIAELERVIGQKQLTIDFQAKMIDLAEEVYGVDIKKKLESKPPSTSGSTGNNSSAV
jgi:transposase-like protein